MKAPVFFDRSGTRYPVTALYAVRVEPSERELCKPAILQLVNPVECLACSAVVPDSKLVYRDF
jgi:hypothetical protein